MTILQKSKVAQAYYESVRSNSTYSGFEKFVATDGETSIFVNSDYQPQPGEAVFKCDTRRLNTHIQLYKSN